MEYKSVVLKFGGSVIPDENGIGRVANVIKKLSLDYNVMAVVVSAMGKTTNNLDAMAHRIENKPNARELDALLATGEMQTAALLSMRLNAIGVPAQGYNAYQCGIKTNNRFGNAEIQHIGMEHINPLYGIPVIAGFQGVTEHGDITTLGREGSDISAVMIAAALCADFCWFFKNRGGIYDKDPHCGDAHELKEVSYTKMLDMLTNERGRVLHKKSVVAAKKYRKPLYVSGIDDLDKGTWILPRVHAKVR